ncbi:hypothetical protein [Pseudonocardia lacus]|uniref:hypothetical protein n=1 Tax=Pseudonocardia lacus TaxID=2835865 RepID=UPI001BDC7368|nr:hypothetical protein [Pseudonocardia lacus]
MRDDLDEGPVGFYEFIWTLNGGPSELAPHDAIDLSRRIARRFVDGGLAQIYAVTWPHCEAVEGPLGAEVLDDPEAWTVRESTPFIASIPN